MKHFPDKAFILAAGLGKRLRPYTDQRPKPLVEVARRSLLARTLDHLAQAGVKEAVINTHYLAPQIPEHLQGRTDIKLHFSHEPELLDTGGGIRKMIGYFGDDPFFVLSGDGLWSDSGTPALQALAQEWNPQTMDILMLLQPVSTMKLTHGIGDYDLDAQGRAKRSRDQSGAHMFTSIRINHPRIFSGESRDVFSYLDLLDRAEEKGRLYGIIHQGDWHHISTPADLEAVDKAFKDG